MRKTRSAAAWACAAALLALGATSLLPARVALVARAVEQVRGRRFERAVPASEILPADLKRILKSKVAESFPAPPEETLRTLVAFGLIEETPRLLEKLVDFYASQVIAFYDPEPRRFFVVRGIDKTLEKQGAETVEGASGMAERLIFAHELTHALQDETLRLDKRLKALKSNGDRALALESLLEGEATVVMVRVALSGVPGADDGAEKMLEPLLSAGALERANLPKDLPEYFVDQLFFPYVEGTAYVRRILKKGGWPAVDRAWATPPASTSAILHENADFNPRADLLPSEAGALAPVGARLLYTDTLGEWSVRFLLRKSLETDEADLAAAGWRGDRIAFYSSERGISYLWRVALESPEAAERFEAAWKKARTRKESVLRKGSDVLVAAGFEKLPEQLK